MAEEEFNDEFFEWEERKDEVLFHQHMIAGSIAGVVEHTAFLPIDTIKTHQQSLLIKKTVPEILGHVYQQPGGVFNFWRGSSIMMIGCVPAHALFFSIYEVSQRMFGIHDSNHYNFDLHAAVGALSSAFHDLIMLPCEVIKQRSQLENEGVRSIIRGIVKEEGIRSFWRSYPISYMMNVPYQSLIVASNEVFKKVLRRKKIELNFATYFGCASLAGLIASCFTMPLDNVRTKMNTQCDLIPQPACPDKIECQCTKQRQGAIKYRNSWTTTTYIWRQEGLRGFFKGLIPRATTQSLSSAVSWTTYELIKAKFLSSNALRKH